jgi:hypothetical protein
MHAYERHRTACVLRFPTPDASMKSPETGPTGSKPAHSGRGTGLKRVLPMQLARTYSTIGRSTANQPATVSHIPVDCRFRFGAVLVYSRRHDFIKPTLPLATFTTSSSFPTLSFQGRPSDYRHPPKPISSTPPHDTACLPYRAPGCFASNLSISPHYPSSATPQLSHAFSTVFDSWFVTPPQSDLPGDG